MPLGVLIEALDRLRELHGEDLWVMVLTERGSLESLSEVRLGPDAVWIECEGASLEDVGR